MGKYCIYDGVTKRLPTLRFGDTMSVKYRGFSTTP